MKNQIFVTQVWEITKLIPKGRVSTYGAIAKAIGFPNHSRHVGKVMSGCPKDVPAHRVVGACGKLSVPEFEIRLKEEGISVCNGKLEHFKEIFWDPMLEL